MKNHSAPHNNYMIIFDGIFYGLGHLTLASIHHFRRIAKLP